MMEIAANKSTQYQFGKWSARPYSALIEIRLTGADSRECLMEPPVNFFAYLNLMEARELAEELCAAIESAKRSAENPPGLETPKSIRQRMKRWVLGKGEK